MSGDSQEMRKAGARPIGNGVYLHDVPREEAETRLRDALARAGLYELLGTEVIPVNEGALGRVTAAPVWARLSSPHYHAAAMDGFAVDADTTHAASPSAPIMLNASEANAAHHPGETSYVDTGDPLPSWANAVIPIETVEPLDDQGELSSDVRSPTTIRIRTPAAPWSNVRALGEDIVASQLVLPAGHVLRPVDLGAIAASGHSTVLVARRPRVAIIPTGNELVPLGTVPAVGAIPEYNSIVIAAQIEAMGGTATRFPIVKDRRELLMATVRKAAQEHDLILINAGSSAGAEDFSASVIDALGSVLVHGVAVRPGHPVIFGMLNVDSRTGARERPVVGVPGYPVSAALTVEIFVEPLLAVWLGRAPHRSDIVRAELTRKVTSPAGDEDHMRVAVGKVGERLLAAPLAAGAGVITSLVRADGIVVLPAGIAGKEMGEAVDVRLYRPIAELEQTIFCIGSHDVTLDLLAQYLARHSRRLVSSNVGSLGGLIALRRGIAHVAGSHLLDPETAEYNIPYIRKYLLGVPVKAVALVLRQQGLIVRSGNPKGIAGLQDIARPDTVYVNRQKGAGTRVLLDLNLGKLGVSPVSVQGYEREEFTHMAVAAAVAGGRADCGLGIAAAADALGLDFIPLFTERYDLVLPAVHAHDGLLEPLFAVLHDDGFRTDVGRLPGYDTSVMGSILLDDPISE